MELPVVNHPDYVAKINDDNKFPIQKFGAIADYLIKEGVVKKFHIPQECSTETMKTSHSLKYNLSFTTHCNSHTTTDTKSCQTFFYIALNHFMYKCN